MRTPTFSGSLVALVTPFRDGALDERSLRRLTRHYSGQAVDGFILGATSGEGMTLRDAELERLVAIVHDEMVTGPNKLPICLGLSGADTSRLKDRLDETADWPIDFYLISCPYYSRPSQHGMELHFGALANRAEHPVLLYNIPYRTGVNLGNEAMLRLAGHPNIVGLKECSADRNLRRQDRCENAPNTGRDEHAEDKSTKQVIDRAQITHALCSQPLWQEMATCTNPNSEHFAPTPQ